MNRPTDKELLEEAQNLLKVIKNQRWPFGIPPMGKSLDVSSTGFSFLSSPGREGALLTAACIINFLESWQLEVWRQEGWKEGPPSLEVVGSDHATAQEVARALENLFTEYTLCEYWGDPPDGCIDAARQALETLFAFVKSWEDARRPT